VVAATCATRTRQPRICERCDPTLAASPRSTRQRPDNASRIRSAIPSLSVGLPISGVCTGTRRGCHSSIFLDSSGQLIGRGDNPIRRPGAACCIARCFGPTLLHRRDRQDHGDSNGSVELRVVDLQKTIRPRCAAMRTGDCPRRCEIRRGSGGHACDGHKSEPNSDKSYEEAAHAYREAIANSRQPGRSPLLAEAQLAELLCSTWMLMVSRKRERAAAKSC